MEPSIRLSLLRRERCVSHGLWLSVVLSSLYSMSLNSEEKGLPVLLGAALLLFSLGMFLWYASINDRTRSFDRARPSG